VTFGDIFRGGGEYFMTWEIRYIEVTVAQLVRFHINQFPGQDSNPGSLKYKAGVPTTAAYH